MEEKEKLTFDWLFEALMHDRSIMLWLITAAAVVAVLILWGVWKFFKAIFKVFCCCDWPKADVEAQKESAEKVDVNKALKALKDMTDQGENEKKEERERENIDRLWAKLTEASDCPPPEPRTLDSNENESEYKVSFVLPKEDLGDSYLLRRHCFSKLDKKKDVGSIYAAKKEFTERFNASGKFLYDARLKRGSNSSSSDSSVIANSGVVNDPLEDSGIASSAAKTSTLPRSSDSGATAVSSSKLAKAKLPDSEDEVDEVVEVDEDPDEIITVPDLHEEDKASELQIFNKFFEENPLPPGVDKKALSEFLSSAKSRYVEEGSNRSNESTTRAKKPKKETKMDKIRALDTRHLTEQQKLRGGPVNETIKSWQAGKSASNQFEDDDEEEESSTRKKVCFEKEHEIQSRKFKARKMELLYEMKKAGALVASHDANKIVKVWKGQHEKKRHDFIDEDMAHFATLDDGRKQKSDSDTDDSISELNFALDHKHFA